MERVLLLKCQTLYFKILEQQTALGGRPLDTAEELYNI